jgi:hypothetical protein
VELWTIRLRRTGRLAVENAARFPPRRPLPTASTDHPFIYIQKFKNRTYKETVKPIGVSVSRFSVSGTFFSKGR